MATSDGADMEPDEVGTPPPEGRLLPFIFPRSYARCECGVQTATTELCAERSNADQSVK